MVSGLLMGWRLMRRSEFRSKKDQYTSMISTGGIVLVLAICATTLTTPNASGANASDDPLIRGWTEGDQIGVSARQESAVPNAPGTSDASVTAPPAADAGDAYLVQGPTVDEIVQWWESNPLYMSESPFGSVYADCGELDGSGEAVWIDCVPQADPEPAEPPDEDDDGDDGPAPIVVTAEDLARLPIASGELVIQPPMDDPQERWVAVNVETIAYSAAEPQRFTPTLLGQQVEVEVWPVEFVWNFHDPVAEANGESAVYVTTDPGARYPDHTFSHTYTQAVDETRISVLTRWAGQFRGPGTGGWQPIAGSAVTVSASPVFEVREFTPRLVDPATVGN